jgi:4-carboxymuconolactone decarboxylase
MSFVGDASFYQLGAQLRGEVQGPARLSQALRDEDDLDEFYHLFGHECCYAQVWARDRLSRLDRALAIFSMIATLGPSSGTLRVHVRGVTRCGCTRAQLRQVLAMVTWYAGVPTGQQATETVRSALKDLPDVEDGLRSAPPAPSSSADLLQQGRELRRRVLGEERPAAALTEMQQAHEDMLDSHYFGVLWNNNDLTPKQRCLVLLGVMCGANRMHDAERWFGAALRLGHRPEELEEVVMSAGAYCGELSFSSARNALTSALERHG